MDDLIYEPPAVAIFDLRNPEDSTFPPGFYYRLGDVSPLMKGEKVKLVGPFENHEEIQAHLLEHHGLKLILEAAVETEIELKA